MGLTTGFWLAVIAVFTAIIFVSFITLLAKWRWPPYRSKDVSVRGTNQEPVHRLHRH